MQTFLPVADFKLSAKLLDYQRLGKQRVECLQLLRGQFPNHPCHNMWRGYRPALALYGIIICNEWRERGYADSCALKIDAEVGQFFGVDISVQYQGENASPRYRTKLVWDKLIASNLEMPPWLGDEAFHRSHRSNLMRKNAKYYGERFSKHGIEVPPDNLEYIWPDSGRTDECPF